MVVGSNKDVAAVSFITLHDDNIEDYEKQDIVTNTEFELIWSSIKKYVFHNHMVDFVNKLELSDQKYQTNGNLKDGNYKGNLLFPIK